MTDYSDRTPRQRVPDSSLRARLVRLPRHAKQMIMLAADAIGLFCCVLGTSWVYLIRPLPRVDFFVLAIGTMLFSHLVARYLGFYHSMVRYLGMGLLMAGAKVAVSSALVLTGLAWLTGMTTTPYRAAVVYAAFTGLYMVGSRYFAQYLLINRSADKENVVIYGAGEAGARVLQAIRGDQTYYPVAFIDDNPNLQGQRLAGLKIYDRKDLEKLIERNNVTRVLLAMPAAPRHVRRAIVSSLEPLRVHVQTVPDFNDLISGKAQVDEIREVDVEDLLTRQPVAPDGTLMQATVFGKAVLVTGAGGSIGSELCRQILRVGPKVIVLFEISEVSLYQIDKELRALVRKFEADIEIVPLLGSVQDPRRIREVMERFDIDTVYHAAAYKHVPMVEKNIIEGACNNVLGTLHTAKAAISTGVRSFVLVSTDKAVSPTNVMGATKRLAEQILQSLQETTDTICFSIVRFGNVLESSGSVVPLFREQIKHGGPITVTHPKIIRYFMTIPEAAQLVIQAGAMAKGGDVFVLDMGEPVKIVDLARRMVALTGLSVRDEDNPNGDIEIEFTGLRPAEKLYEELLLGDNVSGTEHPRIMRAEEHFTPAELLMPMLAAVEDAARDLDRGRMREILGKAVKEYRPSDDINDLLWDTTTSRTIDPGRKLPDSIH